MRIYLSKPHMSGKEEQLVSEAFDSNFIAPLGPHLDEFENSVAEYLKEDGLHCVGLSSGTAALHLALRISGIDRGDEVWISSMTFAGGVFPVSYLGATPRFFDIDSETWCMDIDLISEELLKASRENRLPKAIVPTALYGQSVDLTALERLTEEFNIPLIIDSAESFGAEAKKGRKAGTGGDAAILSFNGNKIITTSGGGMLVTRHKKWAEEARFLSTQARDSAPHYQHSTIGYNYRLSNICAAIGLGQMKVLDDRVNSRRNIFARYKESLSVPGIQFMPETKGHKSTRWLTALTIDSNKTGVSRDEIMNFLLDKEIESRPLWKPMHLQPVFKGLPYHGTGLDETLFKNGMCLPSSSDLTVQEQEEVIGHICGLLKI